MALTISAAEAAERLGITLSVFQRRRRRLRQAGFPEPVPGLFNRYDPLAIEAWLARQRTPTQAAERKPLDEQDWDRILDERAAAFAHQEGRA